MHIPAPPLTCTYPGRGAAGPFCGRGLTARVLRGAAELPRAVTCYAAGGVSGLGPDYCALREAGDARGEVGLLARSRPHVAGVALRAAVLVVGAANRLTGRRRETM